MKHPDYPWFLRSALRFFRWFCHSDYAEDIEGDLREKFERNLKHTNLRTARWRILKEIILLFRPSMIRPLSLTNPSDYPGMFKNQLRITYRYAFKNKAFFLFTVLGLSLGLACTAGIYLWVSHELSYNQFHQKADQLFQVELLLEGWERSLVTPAPLAAALEQEYPEILKATRYNYLSEGTLISHEDKRLVEKGAETDSSFFEMFDFAFKAGSAKNFQGNAIILTETTAHKHFGDQDPLGELVLLNNEETYLVAGVLEDIPANSSFQFDFLIPFKPATEQDQSKAWGAWFCATFIQLDEPARPQNLLARTSGFKTLYHKIDKDRWSSELVPLTDLYFHDKTIPFFPKSGDIKYVWIFSIAGLLLFVVSGLNYVSLSTSKFIRHFRQIGLEKVLGAGYWHTVHKYSVEALFHTILALIVAVLLVVSFQRYFLDPGSDGIFSAFGLYQVIPVLLGITGIMILLTTFIPALIFRSAQPIALLKKTIHLKPAGFSLRKSLVIFQFWVSIGMVISMVIFREQLIFIQQKDLGYQKENLVSIKLNEATSEHLNVLKNTLLQHSRVVDVSRSTFEHIYFDTQISDWEGKEVEGSITVRPMTADSSFANTFDIEVIAGRFYENRGSDDQSVVINQKAADDLGLASPVGRKVILPWNDQPREIIGVVNDFNYWGLTKPIEPVFIFNGNSGNLYVRIKEEEAEQTLDFIKASFEQLYPDYPIEYVFLAERFNQQHASHRRTGKVFSYFGGISMVVSCLSLLAMITFTAEQKTKEIGIRKVNGASVRQIIQLLIRDFVGYVLMAFILAFPITWFIMQRWLQLFSDRIHLSVWYFLAGGILTLVAALLTIIFHATKAALINPIHALKDE